MIYEKYDEGRIDIPKEFIVKVTSSFFTGLNDETINGGAIYANTPDSRLFFNDLTIYSCSAKNCGGIYVSSSLTCSCNKICGNLCSNVEGRSIFSIFISNKTIYCSLYSTHFCTGFVSTTITDAPSQTIRNVNSTNNKGIQEASFLIRRYDYASLQFADFHSNNVDYICLNFYTGKYIDVSNIHYQNCTLKGTNQNHVQCHNANEVYIQNSYIYIDEDDPSYAIGILSSSVVIENVFLPGSSKNNLNISNGQINYKTIETKTLIYTYFDTFYCPAIVPFCKTLLVQRNYIFNLKTLLKTYILFTI